LTAIAFACCRCVSIADQMQFFADAPLSTNMRTQMQNALWRPILQARPTEQQPIINNNDQEDGPKKSQPDSKEFRSDGAERSTVTFFAHVEANHQQLTKSEDRS